MCNCMIDDEGRGLTLCYNKVAIKQRGITYQLRLGDSGQVSPFLRKYQNSIAYGAILISE